MGRKRPKAPGQALSKSKLPGGWRWRSLLEGTVTLWTGALLYSRVTTYGALVARGRMDSRPKAVNRHIQAQLDRGESL